MRINKNLIVEITEYLLVIFVILECNTVYSVLSNDLYLPEVTTLLLIVLFFLNLLKPGIPRSELNAWVKFVVPYMAWTIIFALISVSSGTLMGYAARFLLFLPLAVLIFDLYQKKGKVYILLYKFVNVIILLAIISLFFWVTASQLHLISPTSYVYGNWGTNGYNYPCYYGLYFERQTQTFLFYSGLRNQGIFTEAPMYSLCLCIAIAVELFLSEEHNYLYHRHKLYIKNARFPDMRNPINWKLNLLIITLLTTVTTSGIIIMILMLVMSFVLMKPESKMVVVIKALFGAVVVVGGLMAVYYVFLSKASSSSWRTRMDDYRAGLMAWMTAPFFGTGYNETNITRSFYSFFRVSNQGYSNSVMRVLSQGGIVFFSLYIFPMMGFFVSVWRKREFKNMAFLCVVIIEFVVTIFPYKFLMLMILALFYSVLLTQRDI